MNNDIEENLSQQLYGNQDISYYGLESEPNVKSSEKKISGGIKPFYKDENNYKSISTIAP